MARPFAPALHHLWLALTGLLGLLAFAGCADGKSYVLLTMRLDEASMPINDFATVEVTVSAGMLSDTLMYPARPGPTLNLTAARNVTLSVSFSDSISGEAMLSVRLLNLAGAAVGFGTTGVTISSGRVAYATVNLSRMQVMPGDGGAPDGGDGDSQANFACTPATASGCQAGFTCGVSCLVSGDPAAVCIQAGNKQPGETCTGSGECAPGSQCFRDLCGVRVCRRYCNTDSECPTGGSCFTQVECSMPPRPTGVRICSQPCDPRGQAKTGCAEGLRCFIFPGEVTDCDCPRPAAEVKGDGEPCTDAKSCQSGLLCVTMGGSPVCRPVCRLDDPGTCGADRTCQMLTTPNYSVFGACVP